jgi:pimeloyl-ACP methyl ester carboxylesterase
MMAVARKFNLKYWLRLVIIITVASYLGIILLSGIWMALMLSVPLQGPVCCLNLPHEDMQFRTADGLSLIGWYVPSQNGATLILLHSYYMDRRQTLPVAEMLAKNGYGLLMYDQRASGESDGTVRSLGSLDIPDVSEAVKWLVARQKNDKIGVYGCSMGGAIAVAAAARNPAIQAVAADAPSPLTLSEDSPSIGTPGWAVNLPVYSLAYGLVSLRAWALPLTTTPEAISQITPRSLLLISTGEGVERARMNEYYNIAGTPKELWNIPEAVHCGGVFARPEEYEQHLVDFFNDTLLDK